ncbi:pilus assembly protein PilM [Desulfosporosinus nitroreducens]|uniref:Pilus assembly protein PilM n=1 Tax=Desulfosporosinus nitroreducens TaxID=2018668 RepID=A0ABT8QNJ7_9FIRM|nr:pilus assembly protein PilM [Desulfosporosinus nitroreducens]MDO0822881.1 pilus assembly protein PilM [Desulfosporosinus nitroreducens]
MFKQKQWLAVIKGNHWVVAKVARHKSKLDILHLLEFRAGSENEFQSVQDQLGEDLRLQKEDLKEEKQSNAVGKTDLLKEWLNKNRIPVNKLRIAVSCQGVITRMITLPLMSTQDLDRLLTEQVDQYFTLNILDYVVDYRVLEHFKEDGEMRLRVLLAALPKYQWKKLWSEWEEIGFKPKVVDLAADGLARLYSQLTLKGKNQTNIAELGTPLDLAIVDLSAERVEFILLEQGVFFLFSDLEVSLNELDQVAITVHAQGLDHGQAEEGEDSQLQTAKLNAWAKKEIEMTLGSVLQSLSEFFSFFAARHFGKSIDRIYITGDYVNLPYLQEIFENNLEITTQIGFPNAWSPCFSKKMSIHQKNGMKYGSLYGLALREG